MLRGISSGVIVIDREGRLVLINDAACRILEVPDASALLDQPCRLALSSCPDVARLLLETFEVRTPPNRAELELRHRRDGGRTIGYTLSLVRDACDQVIGAAMFFKDLTWIERLEEQARLKDRLIVLGQMAAGLAHEMRNPLAAIEIHAGLLRRAIDPAVTAHVESLNHILTEVRHLNETVANCLDFVRPVEVAERTVPVEALLDEVVAEPASSGPRIERTYVPGGTFALGDPVQLRQVFANLVRNARDAAGSSGTVAIRTRLASDRTPTSSLGVLIRGEEDAGCAPEAGGVSVVVEIADTGPGIAPELRDRVFQPFFTTKPKGSGLGLAMVQKIVQSHRGRVDFSSPPGGGTVFRVVLRAAAGPGEE